MDQVSSIFGIHVGSGCFEQGNDIALFKKQSVNEKHPHRVSVVFLHKKPLPPRMRARSTQSQSLYCRTNYAAIVCLLGKACLTDALELAVVVGSRITSDVDEILGRWDSVITDRKGSSSHRLSALLVEQPVVDIASVSKGLGITDRAARNLVQVACERGILAKMGDARRGAFYQATELIDVLEEASSISGIRRIAAR